MMINTIDLFSGCGGMSLGFQNAGAFISAAFEYWEVAAKCYENNFKHPVFRTDLSNPAEAVKIISPLNPTLIIGGPPCQDFSHAGKRIESDRADLTESFAEIIDSVKPAYFVMENVDRAQKSAAYANAKTIFIKSGYGLTEVVLDASRCGVPQKRKRFFCIGVLNGIDNALLPYLNDKIAPTEMTIRDFFSDRLGFTYYYRHPRNYNRRAIFSIDEPAPTMRGVNRPVPKGYPGHPNDACPLNDNIRALTTAERALIQTFPSDFIWSGTKTDMEQMIGNAVPVKLAEFVATALIEYVKDTEVKKGNSDDFLSWLLHMKQYSSRSAKDVLSRCKRADYMIQIPQQPDAYYLFLLEQQEQFKHLSPAVKSQIKRAINLYCEYLSTS
jgi:DNA (cytosine-5)-methyltransferase 1